MSALTLRKKRNLGNCLTNSTLNPKTLRFGLEGQNKGLESTWNVEDYSREQMENGHQITKIETHELIQRLKIFDSTASDEEINRLLIENQGDSISVMNILKEKSKQNKKLKNPRKKIFHGKQLRQQILEKLKQKKLKEKTFNMSSNRPITTIEESPSESVEKRTNFRSHETEKSVKFESLLNRFLQCKHTEDLKALVKEITDTVNKELKEQKRLKSENYILKMGIRQRKILFDKEVKKKVRIENELKEKINEVNYLRQKENNMQHSFNTIWMNDHNGKQGF